MRVEMPGEQLLLDHVDTAAIAGGFIRAELAPVAVGKGHVMHVGQQRTKAGVLSCLAGR
jgi:hypothetical protein